MHLTRSIAIELQNIPHDGTNTREGSLITPTRKWWSWGVG
jgi:hypothetical protein